MLTTAYYCLLIVGRSRLCAWPPDPCNLGWYRLLRRTAPERLGPMCLLLIAVSDVLGAAARPAHCMALAALR